MPQLRDRNKAIPNGRVYRQPETGFQPTLWSSFDSQVRQVMGYRRGNPFLAKQHNWHLDYNEIAKEIDSFLAKVCMDSGWTKYVTDGDVEVKKKLSSPAFLQRLAAVAAGAETLVDWISHGAESVPAPKAEMRALVCSVCPENGRGGFESYFTKPVSEAIRKEMSKRGEWNLSTTHDKELGVCQACHCPLPLMVHVPLEMKLKHLPQDARERLDLNCWIRREGQL
jgi:hypothetical protein